MPGEPETKLNGLLTVPGGTLCRIRLLVGQLTSEVGDRAMKGILLGAAATLLGTAAYVMIGIALASVG